MREIEITINNKGEIEVQGFGLEPGEKIEDIAKFLIDPIGDVMETGHKHTHMETTKNTVREKS
jgi:hypothetical protein